MKIKQPHQIPEWVNAININGESITNHPYLVLFLWIIGIVVAYKLIKFTWYKMYDFSWEWRETILFGTLSVMFSWGVIYLMLIVLAIMVWTYVICSLLDKFNIKKPKWL